MQNITRLFSLAAIPLSALISSCHTDDPEVQFPSTATTHSTVATEWFDLTLTLTKETSGFTPPVAARAFGYSGIALYQSVVPGMPDHQSLSGQLTDFTTIPAPEADKEYHWPSCANAAMASMTRHLYANASAANLSKIDSLEAAFLAEFTGQVRADVRNRSVQFGQAVATAVLEWSKSDGGHEGYARNFPDTYTPPVFTGAWVPTAPAYSRALQPYWGNNRPFIRANVLSCQPATHPAYSVDPTSLFFIQATEVYSVSRSLTNEQKTIARFWSDDAGKTATPAGHSVAILTQVLRQENASLATAAEAYAKIGIAVSDAFVSCWKAKYTHTLIRPITYIHQEIDPNWSPLLTTPPFPEFVSGHSVQSGASAEVLAGMFGYQYTFADQTHMHRTDINGGPRTFHSFYDAAKEAALSQLYGGIHYRAAIDLGVEQGTAIGKNVNALAFRKSAVAL